MDPCERTAIIRQGRLLEEEHQAHVKRAALLLDAERNWKKSLSGSDRRNRDYVLAAIQSEKVPPQLQWNSGNLSRGLVNDKEIMLQRLELESFESTYKNSAYKVPAVFRNDKQVMLKIVSKSSGSLIHASKTLKKDRDVVLAAIQNKQPCAPLAIKHASKKLQGDKKIARVVLGHGHGIKALSLLPSKIQQDCNLFLQAIQWSSDECNESFETLKGLPEELLDDYDIVYEAVKRRGSNLQYVTDKSLLQDIDIVMAACENDGSAIQYVPKCPARDEMLEENNLIVLIENGGHCILEELGEEFILNRKYLLAAVKTGMVVPEGISVKLYEKNHPLFKTVLRQTNQPFKQYEAFPESIRNDANVGTDILKTNASFGEGSWAARFAEDIPKDVMRNHIEPLMKMAKNEFAYTGGDTWDEKSIVLSLCKIKGGNFDNVSLRLRADVDVAKAAFGRSRSVGIYTITQCPRTLFQANHDIAGLAITACSSRSPGWHVRSDLFRHFGHLVTSSRPFVLAWIKKGWHTRYQYGRHIPFFRDSAMALEAIKDVEDGERSAADILKDFTSNFRGNKTFMLKAVEANPTVIKCVSEELLYDFDFLLRGISASKASLVPFSHQGKDFDLLADFATNVRETLSLTDGVVLHFFGAMSIDPSSSSGGNKRANKRRRTGRNSFAVSRCHLRMLEMGGEGGEWIKRNIAEYADIPVGPHLKLYRMALENLKFWGY